MKDELVYVCEICQTPLLEEHHCKAQCPNCGRMFDCSDLPIMRANMMITDHGAVRAPGTDPRDILPLVTEDNGEETAASEAKPNIADLP